MANLNDGALPLTGDRDAGGCFLSAKQQITRCLPDRKLHAINISIANCTQLTSASSPLGHRLLPSPFRWKSVAPDNTTSRRPRSPCVTTALCQ